MKTIRLPKAGSIGDIHPKKVKIVIDDDIPELKTLEEMQNYYDNQARILAEALTKALPQGIIEPLMIRLMEKRVSLYVGVMENTS